MQIEYKENIRNFIKQKKIPRYMFVAASAWISRLFCAGAQILTIPLIIDLVGMEGYECFILMNSVAAWYLLMDFGMGASLQNYISESRVNGKSYISYIYFVGIFMLIVLLTCSLILSCIPPRIAEIILQKYSFLESQQKYIILYWMSIIGLMNCISTVMLKIWYGEQRGYLSNIVPAIGTLISSVTLLLLIYYKVKTSILIVMIVWLLPSTVISFSVFLKRIYIGMKSERFLIKKYIAYQVIQRGIKFWIFAIAAALTLQIDYIVMSQFIQGSGIVEYNITSKVYSLAFVIYTAVVSALWPVFTEEISKNNWNKIYGYIKKYIIIGIVLFLVTMASSLICMPYIVTMFLHTNLVVIENSFIILMGFYYMLRVWTDFFSMVLQSMSEMNIFAIAVPIQAGLSIICQYMLVTNYQIYGIVMGLIISFLATTAWCLPYKVYEIYQSRRRK